jgi:hypothetical protein
VPDSQLIVPDSKITNAHIAYFIQEHDKLTISTFSPEDSISSRLPVATVKEYLPESFSIVSWLQESEKQINELKALQVQLQGCVEEELYDKMRLEGTDTIGTNLFCVLKAMGDKQKLITKQINLLKVKILYWPHPAGVTFK